TVSTTFSASGTITVDASAITRSEGIEAVRTPVLSASSFPAGITWQLYDPYVEGRSLVTKTENGIRTLYLNAQQGTIISIR
ncbi:MAG: hypothetical protein IJR99_13995, partial [Kiritimatiellae bacterium]|nr:hypothetical protein [Kiritimatiellia bacterium]